MIVEKFHEQFGGSLRNLSFAIAWPTAPLPLFVLCISSVPPSEIKSGLSVTVIQPDPPNDLSIRQVHAQRHLPPQVHPGNFPTQKHDAFAVFVILFIFIS